MKVFVTPKMTGKMFGLRSINVSPLANPFCLAMAKLNVICVSCYSQRLEKLYGATKENGRSGKVLAWVKNGKVLSKRLLKDSEVPVFRSVRPCRFDAHGELHNRIHLFNYIQIAEANPHVPMALWTKRLDLTKGALKQLDNLVYVYSVPEVNKLHRKLPAGFHKVFTVVSRQFTRERNLDNLVNCGKHCAECLKCYSRADETTHIYERLK
jgi:hypothetical protein